MTKQLSLRRGFLAAAILFGLSIAAGWAFAREAEPFLRPGLENLAGVAEQSAQFGPEYRSAALTVFIFLKNLSVAAILVLVGHVAFALPAVFILGVNGILIGLLARVFLESGTPLLFLVAGIAPHGVLELPALLLAAAVAFAVMVRRIRGRPIPRMGDRLGFLLRVITPLLLLAAVIEVYVTPLVLNRVPGGA